MFKKWKKKGVFLLPWHTIYSCSRLLPRFSAHSHLQVVVMYSTKTYLRWQMRGKKDFSVVIWASWAVGGCISSLLLPPCHHHSPGNGIRKKCEVINTLLKPAHKIYILYSFVYTHFFIFVSPLIFLLPSIHSFIFLLSSGLWDIILLGCQWGRSTKASMSIPGYPCR